MESGGEGGGGGSQKEVELGFTEIETKSEALSRAEVFHIVKEVIGFVLFMHNQIPLILQDLENGFTSLKKELEILVESGLPAESKLPEIRKYNMRKKEVKNGIKKHEKLMKGISDQLFALQEALNSVSVIEEVRLVIGGSLARPLYVYDIQFSVGKFCSGTAKEGAVSKVAQTLSKKAIRALVSNGAGSSKHTGPSKLFLLIKGPSHFNMPLQFLPKRDLRYSKKATQFGLHIKCRHVAPQKGNDDSLDAHDVIWFQCRHAVKGLACKKVEEC
ncbi:hypothetical protein LUZ61_005259 [Rhynchospora tenuis]|uniref:Uncharacterized protein n=1 Tax=Rhynchospora tenuis TaxID=198213 RepID=A0AAD5ZP82_9POAL|nr:hypothetical protein LUZ61_005259 [Rhynchospora tenuis]